MLNIARVLGHYRKLLHCTLPVGVRSIAISLSVCQHISGTAGPIFIKFLTVPRGLARSSSGGVVICYTLPALWMRSRLAVMGRVAYLNTEALFDFYECLVLAKSCCTEYWQWLYKYFTMFFLLFFLEITVLLCATNLRNYYKNYYNTFTSTVKHPGPWH